MISGYLLLIVIFVLFLIISAVFIFCYWYGDNSTKYVGFATMKDISNGNGTNPKEFKKQCSCTDSFKGLCEDCETPEFVNDGELGKMPDFRGYGGNLGLDGLGIGATAKHDPTRSFMGKGMNPWNGPAHGTIKQDHFV